MLKHIPLRGAFNVRDLGGYPTADGRHTKWGLLYRSDSLSELTDEDWAGLMLRNIRTVVDLRSLPEISSAKVKIPDGITYYHFSLMQELDEIPDLLRPDPGRLVDEEGLNRFMESMRLDYKKTLFCNIRRCTDILSVITDRIGLQTGSVIFMCSAGKDRTGIVAAMLLYLCNVIREDIIADYMVSNIYNTRGVNKRLSSFPEALMKLIPDPGLLKSCLESEPETIIKLLDAIDAADIRSVLAANGFTLERQEQFRKVFTEAI